MQFGIPLGWKRRLPFLVSLLACSCLNASDAGSDLLEIRILKIIPEFYFPNSPAKISVLVENAGTASSPANQLWLMLSTDDQVSDDDQVLKEIGQDPLTPGEQITRNWTLSARVASRNYWLFVCRSESGADRPDPMTCSDAHPWTVPPVDLAMLSLQVRPEKLIPGNPVAARAVWKNDGTQITPSTTLRFKLSRNESLSPGDPDLAVEATEPVEGGERAERTAQFPIDIKPGDYWLGACLDPVPGERSRDNNCSFPVKVQVVEDAFPDLVVDVVRVRPLVWVIGQNVDFYAEVLNIGRSGSGPGKLHFYLSDDQDIDGGDYRVGTADLEPVPAEAVSQTGVFVDPAQFPGVYWVGACVEPDDEENEIFNNCMAGPSVEILVAEPEAP